MLNTIKEDWNNTAKAYEEFNAGEASYSYNIEWPCILSMLPDLKKKSILDLGCGTGIFTFLLEQSIPSKLVGIDVSKEMLKIAEIKAQKQLSKAKFMLGDISDMNDYIDKPFDFIFSSTTTHYINDLHKLFNSIANALVPDGCCILSIIHPVYSAMYPIKRGDTLPDDDEWTVRYLDKSERSYIQPWIEYNDTYENCLSTSYHHLMSDYINAIIQSGLKICEIKEPFPPEDWKNSNPARYEGFIETPTYMIIKLTK